MPKHRLLNDRLLPMRIAVGPYASLTEALAIAETAKYTARLARQVQAASSMLGGARRDQPARLEQIDDTPSKLGRRSRGRVKHEIGFSGAS